MDVSIESGLESSSESPILESPNGQVVPATVAAGSNRYELTIIMKPTLDDETRKAQMEQISSLMVRFGATIEKVDEWGKKRLAYEIQKIGEGFYYIITFLSAPSAPEEIEKRIRIMENLLRYLIIRVDE